MNDGLGGLILGADRFSRNIYAEIYEKIDYIFIVVGHGY